MTVVLPDHLWLTIWHQVEPTPPEMGLYSALNKQQHRVLSDDTLWRSYSLEALAEGLPLKDAFLKRAGERTMRGNRCLAMAHRGELRIRRNKSDSGGHTYVEDRRFAYGQYTHAGMAPYLRLGPCGRDDDFDVACAGWAVPTAWGDFSRVVRTSEHVAARAIVNQPLAVEFFASATLTPRVIRAGLRADGGILQLLPRAVLRSKDYAECAIPNSSAAYALFDDAVQADREIAQLHVASHPAEAHQVWRHHPADFSLFTDACLLQLRRKDCSQEMLRDVHLWLKFLRIQPEIFGRPYRWLDQDEASLISQAWMLAEDSDRRRIKRLLRKIPDSSWLGELPEELRPEPIVVLEASDPVHVAAVPLPRPSGSTRFDRLFRR